MPGTVVRAKLFTEFWTSLHTKVFHIRYQIFFPATSWRSKEARNVRCTTVAKDLHVTDKKDVKSSISINEIREALAISQDTSHFVSDNVLLEGGPESKR